MSPGVFVYSVYSPLESTTYITHIGACNLVTMVHFQFIIFMCQKAMNEHWNYRLLLSFYSISLSSLLEKSKRIEIEHGDEFENKGYELHTSHSRLHLLIYYLNSSMLPI